MSLSNTDVKNTYNGNGSTIYFTYTFTLPASSTGSEVGVYITDSDGITGDKLTTGYTVDLDNQRVIYPDPYDEELVLPSGSKITLRRESPLVQNAAFRSQTFNPQSAETALDKTVMMIQEMNEKVSRAVVGSLTTETNYTLPEPEAEKVIGWNTAGDGIINYSNPGSAVSEAQAAAAAAAISQSEAANSVTEAAGQVTLAEEQVTLAANQVTLASDQVTLAAGQVALAAAEVTLATTQATNASNSASVAASYALIAANSVRFWTVSTAYTVGQICYLSAYPYIMLECVIAGTTGTNEPTSFTIGTVLADNGVTWYVKDIRTIGDWVLISTTLAYTSADSPTYTFTLTGDYTSKIPLGARIKLTQTSVKYFIVTAISYSSPNTTITVYGGTDFALISATISEAYYSIAKCPIGFPMEPNKWTIKITDVAQYQQTSPVATTWYNLGSLSITVPIGLWDLGMQATFNTAYDSNVISSFCTLSASSSLESDIDFTVYISGYGRATDTNYKHKIILISSKTVYYLLEKTTSSGTSTINLYGNSAKTLLYAQCVYL